MNYSGTIHAKVKVLTITKQKQKLRFQIRHPEKAEAIVGIAVTSTLIGRDSPKGNTAGYLSLSIPQKGDVIYGEDVKVDNNEFADLLSMNITGESIPVDQSQKREYFLDTNHPVSKAILEGFYEDVFAPDLNSEGGIPKPFLYKVRIYLRYKVKQVSRPVEP